MMIEMTIEITKDIDHTTLSTHVRMRAHISEYLRAVLQTFFSPTGTVFSPVDVLRHCSLAFSRMDAMPTWFFVGFGTRGGGGRGDFA